MDPAEQKALDDIEEYGCHIIHVMAEGELPPFSYSIGINTTSGRPDVCVIGLKQPIAQFVINHYNAETRSGIVVDPGTPYTGYLEGFEVFFERVSTEFYREYFGWALWYHDGLAFDMLQLIYPTTSGIYPWSDSAPEDFIAWQPILSTSAGKLAPH